MKIIVAVLCCTVVLFCDLANAEILPSSVIARTAENNLYQLKNPSDLKLINSEERPIVSVITTAGNLDAPLFYQKIDCNATHYKNPFSIKAKTYPVALQGIPYFELDRTKKHDFECVKTGNVFVMFDSARTQELASFLNGFSRLGDYELRLNNDSVFHIYQKQINKGDILKTPEGVVVAGFATRTEKQKAETLYNGVVLNVGWKKGYPMNDSSPMPVPYLENIPSVIGIEIGRQLFVDDFLIEKTNMVREFHKPQKYEGNPVLKPETKLETLSRFGNNPVAAPLSGSILWNPDKQVFQMWYEAGHLTNLAYAESKDGLNWYRPNLHIEEGTNRVLPKGFEPDSWSVFNDFDEKDPSKKFKMFFRSHDDAERRAMMFTSPDGINWKAQVEMGRCGDRSTMIYNPFRKKWIASIRFWNTCKDSYGFRTRAYYEADSFEKAMDWHPYEAIFWTRTDKYDYRGEWEKEKPQLYNLDAVAYESIMLGVYQIMYGPDNYFWAKKGLPKSTGLNLAYSRDGFHWHRPDRTLAVKSEYKSTWDNGYIQSVSNILCVMGDKLYFYYTGFAGDKAKTVEGIKKKHKTEVALRVGSYSGGATGVAFLRRDGFASMNSNDNEAELQTRPVRFSGSYLFVNGDVKEGALYAQLEDAKGNPVAPFTFENCVAFRGDSTIKKISWKNADNLLEFAGKPMRIKFKIKGKGKLYSFWVSKDNSGRSDGYVAGGGKGFSSQKDTVGIKAYEN